MREAALYDIRAAIAVVLSEDIHNSLVDIAHKHVPRFHQLSIGLAAQHGLVAAGRNIEFSHHSTLHSVVREASRRSSEKPSRACPLKLLQCVVRAFAERERSLKCRVEFGSTQWTENHYTL
ncbi:hypothetical protein [Tardiphaga sp. P9-11]|uniref:hypothetical protein n=1 Tax=Tardiphaga sp. P9-11 TaxID=2024614 RepID=UPI0011F0B3BB|nr:hypothetical protein [Tardiphaga sp. P9-11]